MTPCWLDQTFSIKYLKFTTGRWALKLSCKVQFFDADYKNVIFEKILYIHAVWLALKILKNNRH